jgi:mercuric ion transport protein
MRTVYLLPLTVFSLALGVAALGFRANWRRGYGPLAAGILAAVLLLVGKFVLNSNVAVYGGLASLIGASLWNSWPKKSVPPAPRETLLQLGSKRSDEHGYQTQD